MQEKTSYDSLVDSNTDKRRYPRLPMAMKAIVREGVLDNTACVIRDFAPGGLLIKWQDDSGHSIFEQSQSIEGEEYTVEFVVGVKGGDKKTFSIRFRVARVFQDGMGVSFVKPNQQVLNTLIKIADITGRKAKEKLNKDLTEHIGKLDSQKPVDLGATNTDNLEGKINSILTGFFAKLHNRFIVLTKNTVDEKDKFEFFAAHELLSQDLKGYRKSILQAVISQLKDEESQSWEKVFDESVEGNNLSLVDEKEFEAYLMLTEIISNVETEHKLLLFRATKGISNTYNIVIDEGSNPIGFSRLCRTIDEYLQYKTFGYTSLKEVYAEMHDTLMPELILLYGEITEGIESVPEYKNNDEREFSEHAELSRVVDSNPALPPVNNGLSGNQTTNNSWSQDTHHQAGTTGAFPALEGTSALTPVIKGVEDLTQTLMALKSSLSVPGALDNLMLGNTGNYPSNSDSTLGATTLGVSSGTIHTSESTGTGSGVYIQQNDLLNLIDKIRQEDHQNWKNDSTIQDVPTRLDPLLDQAKKHLNIEEQGAIGIVGGVLDFLRDDQGLSHNVRQDFNRIQSVLYKQAISEGGHFQEPSNPLRNVINILEKLDRKGANSNPEGREVINDLVGKVLALEGYDSSHFEQITSELNALLEKQTSIYEQQIEQVIEQCDREQALVSNVNSASKSPNRIQVERETNGEWDVWAQRAKKMSRGDTVLVDDGKGEKKHLSLAWTDPEATQFVFVDNQGEMAARMTRQELVVRLLKGSAEIADQDGKPVFDRAMVSTLFSAYDEVKEQIINDVETGFLNKENFRLELNKIHKNTVRENSEHALFYLESSFGDNADEKKSAAYMQYLSGQIKSSIGSDCLTGRLDNNSIAIVAEYISREGAMILGETFFKSLEDNIFEYEESPLEFPVAIGLSIINAETDGIDEALFAANEACKKSREVGDNQIWLLEDEDDSSSDNNSIDWFEWLTRYSQDDVMNPLYGQAIEFKKDTKSKPILYLYSAIEEGNDFFRPERYITASNDEELVCKFEKRFFLSCLHWMGKSKKTVSLYQKCIINFSASTINSKDILDFIIQQLSKSSVAPGKICFQVPGALDKTSNSKSIERFIRTLSEFGCQFSLAQYGQDGLTLDMLKLPVNYISIDPVLMNNVVNNVQNFGLIKSINDIAHMVDRKTIVTHAVQDDALELLQDLDIDYLPDNSEDDINNQSPVQLNPSTNKDVL